MPEWGDFEWGDGGWGDGDPVVIDDIADVGGNGIVGPVEFGFIGFDGEAPPDLLDRIYNFHHESIRRSDVNLLWKRLCDGFERIWVSIENNLDKIETLWNVSAIDDEFVRYLLPQVGWTDDLADITDRLGVDAVRRLVASAIPLWKRRGASLSSVEALNVIIGVDAWEWDWFDRRFLIGQTRFGHDLAPSSGWTDARLLSSKARRWSNLRIADAEQALDRELIKRVVNLWRPSGERVLVSYVEFWDRFVDDSKLESWGSFSDGVAAETTIAGGVLAQSDDAVSMHSFARGTALELLSSGSTRARVRPAGSGWFGVVVGFSGDLALAIEARFDLDDNTLGVYQDGVLISDVVQLKTFGVLLSPDVWRTIRVVAHVPQTHLAIWLDNRLVFESFSIASRPGTSGVAHGIGASLECGQFEIAPTPGRSDFVDIN